MSASDGSRPARVALVALVALAALAAPACAHAVAVPDPPDMAPLVAAYDAPGGAFDAEHPAPVLVVATAQLGVLAGGDMSAFFTSVMTSISQRLDATGLGPSGDGAPTHLDAVVSLDLACPGDDGAIAITTVLHGKELSRVLWGTAHRCVVAGVVIDGAITIYRYSPVGAAAEDAAFLARVDGAVTTGKTHRGAIDFRVRSGGGGKAIETRIATAHGDVIVARDGGTIAVRAANGTFACSSVKRTCR